MIIEHGGAGGAPGSQRGESRMWNGQDVDLDAYFRRIGYDGDASPTLDTLRELHRAHVTTIPFENLNAALGRPVPLDVKSLMGKLVGQARGGYCYEQNSLFAAVLERLGFTFAARGARVRRRDAASITPVTHALLIATVDGQPWLCDTGFGHQGPLEPVPLRDGAVVEQGGWTYGIASDGDGAHVLRTRRPGGWTDLYAFTPGPLYPADFTVMNHYSSSHPQSRFVGQVVVQRAAPGVRRALVRDEFTTSRTDGTMDWRSVSADELGRLLSEAFDIVMEQEDLVQLGALAGGVRGAVPRARVR
ncbi:arylamine N-acetyltransferase [Streptomyces sp. NBC_00083]|uniref:arylamine N-acetyltransferase family protein n=1 Tax=Streptomyces sp. NBC_00083 TaxID=2975647 RepID=UPI00224DA380|nr:arylamine N-acetyltransferase [Streptomyces sp. NBC_00083]MCX5386112.1 arylamine N-acetyltransferase [Streptomyces sp. NBC_00083]